MNPEQKKEDQTLSPDWANWALIEAWFEKQCQGVPFPEDKRPELAQIIAERFKQQVGEREHGPRRFVILTNAGLWGVGKTIKEAVKNSKSYSKTHEVQAVLVLNDDTPQVNDWGVVISSSKSAQINLGHIGTVGSILRTKD